MDYSIFFHQTLTKLGFDLVPVYNCFDPPYDPAHGWTLKLPDVEFSHRTLVLLHFQDFVTSTDSGILELEKVERHYKDRAHQILVTHWPHRLRDFYTGPVNLIEFNSHEYMILENLKRRQDAWKDMFDHPRDTAWQSLNGRKSPHRLRVAQILEKLPNGILTYSTGVSLPGRGYDTYPGTSNEDNFIRLRDIYGRACVNIVTETQYDRAPGIITEKTIFALLSGQIPIVIGYPGVVRDCRELGFDMFEDLIDTSYDFLPNDRRAEEAINLNLEVLLGQRDTSSYQSRLDSQKKFILNRYTDTQRQDFLHRAINLARRLLQ